MTALLSPPWLFLHQWGTPQFQVTLANGSHRHQSSLGGMGSACSLEAAQKWPGYGLWQFAVRMPRLLHEQLRGAECTLGVTMVLLAGADQEGHDALRCAASATIIGPTRSRDNPVHAAYG